MLENSRKSIINTQAPALYQTQGTKRSPQPVTPNRAPCATRRKDSPSRDINQPTDPIGNEASQFDKPKPDYGSSIGEPKERENLGETKKDSQPETWKQKKMKKKRRKHEQKRNTREMEEGRGGRA